MNTSLKHTQIRLANGLAVYAKEFDYFKNYLLDFENWFENAGEPIHQDRNVLKYFSRQLYTELEQDIVVKSFRIPIFVSRIIYSFIRPSKARRSFENSRIFLDKGFQVPKPLAFVELKSFALLSKSYFVSENIDVDCSLHEVYRKQMFDWEELLPLVVEQAYHMHQKELLHRDFSPGNVLIKKQEQQFQFFYVDLNRMSFGPVGFEKGLKSFIRLAHDELSLQLIARHYARLAKQDENQALAILKRSVARHRFIKDKKNMLKRRLGLKK